MNAPLTKVELTGVPETALWNLYQRASAARAGHLDDPRAVEVLVRLDYPFERFDLPYRGLAASRTTGTGAHTHYACQLRHYRQ